MEGHRKRRKLPSVDRREEPVQGVPAISSSSAIRGVTGGNSLVF